jgi:hypothetical protein
MVALVISEEELGHEAVRMASRSEPTSGADAGNDQCAS